MSKEREIPDKDLSKITGAGELPSDTGAGGSEDLAGSGGDIHPGQPSGGRGGSTTPIVSKP